jgi:hypothetical protein
LENINNGFADFFLHRFGSKRIYKKRHDIFAKIIHMNLAVKFNLLKDTQPHYIYKPESCLENENYNLYFDRTVLTDIHIQHNRPDIIILNKQQKQAYLLDIAVSNSHNITQTYNTKINKYLELSVAMRNQSVCNLITYLFIIKMPHLSETESIEVLMMIGYGDSKRSCAEVITLLMTHKK